MTRNIMNMGWIAIIGSREPTDVQIQAIKEAVRSLDPKTQAVISGCAYGVDAIALEEARKLDILTIGVLPWPKYNPEIQAFCTNIKCIDDLAIANRVEAYESVQRHHPAPDRLSQGAKKLHARNYGIIRWASHVIAAPSNKAGGGGTGQGMRLAKELDIPLIVISP